MYIFMVVIEGRKKYNFMQWLESDTRHIQIKRSTLQVANWQDNLPRIPAHLKSFWGLLFKTSQNTVILQRKKDQNIFSWLKYFDISLQDYFRVFPMIYHAHISAGGASWEQCGQCKAKQ